MAEKAKKAKKGIYIAVDGTMEQAVHKLLEGTKATIYIPEKVAKQIATALLNEKYLVKPTSIVDSSGTVSCQAKIEITYD